MNVLAISILQASGPDPHFKQLNEKGMTFISPDKAIQIYQYAKDLGDQGMLYQFWIFDQNHQHPYLLNPGDGVDLAGYPAGFRFSPNSQWLVRMQKTGAGYASLFLYHRTGNRFFPATSKPLSDLAWNFFFSFPVSSGERRASINPNSFFHVTAELVKGMDDNYRWMGEHWPDSRYLIVSLSFDTSGHPQLPFIRAWRCVYDLKTGQFSVPAEIADYDEKAFHFNKDD